MFKNYLKTIGLEDLVSHVEKVKLNDIVKKAFVSKTPVLSDEEVKSLYSYPVPKMSPDGSCSIIEEAADKPYNLAETLGLTSDFSRLKDYEQTIRLWRLNEIVHKIYRLSGVNWFGIYRKVTNPKGELVLVKEAYEGLFSRAEFPLTKEFAKKSNNSTVGLSGKAIVIQDVAAHTGAYYKCDGKVNSEFCAPILGPDDEVIGIIDAEAFAANHYTQERLLQIAKVAYDLGQLNIGFRS
jgi:L-methionine (R)-S-oxide reductase